MILRDTDPTRGLTVDLGALEIGAANILAVAARCASLVLGLKVGLQIANVIRKSGMRSRGDEQDIR